MSSEEEQFPRPHRRPRKNDVLYPTVARIGRMSIEHYHVSCASPKRVSPALAKGLEVVPCLPPPIDVKDELPTLAPSLLTSLECGAW